MWDDVAAVGAQGSFRHEQLRRRKSLLSPPGTKSVSTFSRSLQIIHKIAIPLAVNFSQLLDRKRAVVLPGATPV